MRNKSNGKITAVKSVGIIMVHYYTWLKVINSRRMREGYGSRSVCMCVCECVCLLPS